MTINFALRERYDSADEYAHPESDPVLSCNTPERQGDPSAPDVHRFRIYQSDFTFPQCPPTCGSSKHRTPAISMTWPLACLAMSDKILAMIVWLRHLPRLGWLAPSGPVRISMLENLALRQQLLALHAKRPRRRLTAVTQVVLGCAAKGLGLDGNSLSSWLLPERSSAGIVLAFGCIGNGFHEPSRREVASL